MTTVSEILSELERLGDAQTKKTFAKHGAKEPFFGVKVEYLKQVLKKTKKNHELSLGLYKTGNSDAMYLAGLMADETKITEAQLNEWVANAYWSYLSEYAVPWVASETPFGFKLGLEWIESSNEQIASAGWCTLASYACIRDDKDIDIPMYSELLNRVSREIQTSPNRVRYCMNKFVIAIGSYIKDLHSKSIEIANAYGKVKVDMNGTACKVPLATEYIQKVTQKGLVGKKRKNARC